MEGEEAAALAAYHAARRQHPGLRLIVAPRHAERFDEVAALAGTAGRVRSSGAAGSRGPRNAGPTAGLP